MIELTYDQSKAVPGALLVAAQHTVLAQMILKIAEVENADRIVVGAVALSVLISAGMGGEVAFERLAEPEPVTYDSVDSRRILPRKVATLATIPVVVDSYAADSAPVELYRGEQLIGKVNVDFEKIRFI